MHLRDIHFHNVRIRRITEICPQHDLLFEVDYPVNGGEGDGAVEPRVIAFRDVLQYHVHEQPSHDPTVILDVLDHGPAADWHSIELRTNAGHRSLLYSDVEVLEPYQVA